MGCSPSIDVFRGLVYIATGNLYNAPSEVLKCEEAQNNQTSPPSAPDQYIGPDVHFDSIMAFCINSGQILWSTRLSGSDIYYYACLVSPNNPNCPPGPYNDADFGEAPMLLSLTLNGKKRDIVVAVQKSGFAWALDRENGDIVWFKWSYNTGATIYGGASASYGCVYIGIGYTQLGPVEIQL
ncbi:hypothetical protein ACH5RR_035790 [Cinchona calisaya]|uniref:Uncharacterized protein n=1 Tax=Cinchona calisaya TaxID=153742 RepID=A0ABD2Y3P5_9GENT